MTYLAASLRADALCPVRGQGLQPAVGRATTPRRWPGLSGPNDTPMAHAGVLALPQDGIPAPPGDPPASLPALGAIPERRPAGGTLCLVVSLVSIEPVCSRSPAQIPDYEGLRVSAVDRS
jgi:hypothetical protein